MQGVRRARTLVPAVALVAAIAVGGTACLPEPHGLRATADGVLLKAGKPYRGVGVNYFDAFYRNVKDGRDTSYDAGFATLARAGIPFARVMAGGFWPSEQRLYLDDRAEFFRRFDRFVRSAETNGVGLVLSLFWHPATVPDLVWEPVSAWGDPASRTHAHMRRYVRDVVERYRGSSAVWGWEFGNEYSLSASLPNAAEHPWPVHPSLGTPTRRTAADDLTVEMVRTAYVAFATEVRRYDANRFISSGNSIPRESAWHNWQEGTWTLDTAAQGRQMIVGDNPGPMDVVSIHAYTTDIARIPRATRVAATAGKPLFLGEFGASGPGDSGRADLATVVRTIEENDVDLAALWVYDLPGQPEWTVTTTNSRSWQLREVAALHARLQR